MIRNVKKDRSGYCRLCGIWREILCCDHIVPKHKGGTNEPANIQWICANCHQDKTIIELRERHLGKPKSEEHRKKISEGLRGKPKTSWHCENIAESKRAYFATLTPEERKRPEHSAVIKEAWENGCYANRGKINA